MGGNSRKCDSLKYPPKLQPTRKLALLRIPDRQFLALFEGHHWSCVSVSSEEVVNTCKYQGRISLWNYTPRFVDPCDQSELCLYVSKRTGLVLLWDRSPPWLWNENAVWNLEARAGLREPKKPAPRPGSHSTVRPFEFGSMPLFWYGTNRSTPSDLRE